MPNNEEINDDWNDEQHKSYVELTLDNIMGMEFGSVKEAYEFYCTNAKCNSFVARKDNIKKI